MGRLVWIPGAPRVAVEVEGTGPLALLMHGIGGNRTNWREQLPALAGHVTAVAWDARGYGDSDDYEGPLAFDDFVVDVLRVLDYFGAARAHLIGLSMGGRIAMRTALLHPQRVASLTLADTHEGFEAFSPEQRLAFVDTRRAPLLAGKEPSDIADTVARSLVGPKASPQHLAQLVESISLLHKMSYVKSLEATVNQVTVGDLAQIRMPVHFVVGADDRLTPPAMHYEMAKKISQATVSVVPDAGHLSNIENPADFNASMIDWLRTHL